MGIREARFYGSFGPSIPLRIPAVHFACHDEETEAFCLMQPEERAPMNGT
jgi:hypothetical protein